MESFVPNVSVQMPSGNTTGGFCFIKLFRDAYFIFQNLFVYLYQTTEQ